MQNSADKVKVALKRARRSVGSPVRVSDSGDRYRGTVGVVSELVPAFGTVLYLVSSDQVLEYGEPQAVQAWSCLFFPDQLRAAQAKH